MESLSRTQTHGGVTILARSAGLRRWSCESIKIETANGFRALPVEPSFTDSTVRFQSYDVAANG